MSRDLVLLHGFLRTGASMGWLAVQLKSLGYRAVHLPTFGFHLRPLEVHGAALRARLRLVADTEIDVVTFSYGGVLLRSALADPDAPRVRRVVMLSPPNQGAARAEQFRNWIPLHRVGWDPLAQLLPGKPSHLPLPPAEVGVLTGGTGLDIGFNRSLAGDNDGKVRVAEARMEGLADFKVIPHRHFEMPFSARAIAETRCFLQTGRFLTSTSLGKGAPPP